MANFTFSDIPLGPALKNPVDFGLLSNSGGVNTNKIYVRHDANVDLKNVGIYIQPYTGADYYGLYGSSQDYLDFIKWGDTAGKGLIANFDALNGDPAYNESFNSTQGNNISNAIPLKKEAFGLQAPQSDGIFPKGEECEIALSLSIPASETATGVREASLFFTFDQ